MTFKNNRQLMLLPLFVLVTIASFYQFRTPRPQKDCGFVQNIYGQRISWKGNHPVLISIDSSVPAALRPAIYRAAAKWEIQAGKKLFRFQDFVAQDAKLSGPAKDKKNIIYFLKNWDSNTKAEQARTSVYWVGDSIQEADIRINGQQFAYYIEDSKKIVYSNLPESLQLTSEEKTLPENFGVLKFNSTEDELVSTQDFSSKEESQYRFQGPLVGYNFEALMLHELGHFLGLKHRDSDPSVMETYLAAQTDRVVLTAVDAQNLKCEY